MYCLNCGTENQQNARFCCKCGTELNSIILAENQNSNASVVDQAYINQIEQIVLKLQELSKIQDFITQKRKELENNDKILNSYKRSQKDNGKIILLMMVFFLVSLCIVFTTITLITENEKIIRLISFLVAVVVDIVTFKPMNTLIKKNELRQVNRYTERCELIKIECGKMEKNEKELINTLSREIHIIPPNYRYLLAVQYIFDSFVNMRARNMTEAINLYEEQLHRWKIENAQQQMLALSRQQTMAAQINMAANVANAAHNIFS